MIRRSLSWVACAWLVWSSPVRAEDELTRSALAERLFEQGKAAMQAENYSVACPRLAASQQVEPGGGTVLLLGLCLEAQGKLASAWTSYREALGYARRDGRSDRAERAQERILAIEPQLSRLYVRLSPRESNARVFIDGTLLPGGAHRTGLPVDPGGHVVRVERRGAKSFSRSVRVDAGIREVWAEIPALPPRHMAHRVRALPDDPGASQRDVATVLLSTGGAALVSALIAGGIALSWNAKADEQCPDVACDDRQAVARSSHALSAAKVATIAFGVGITFGAAGAVTLFTAPSGVSREGASR